MSAKDKKTKTTTTKTTTTNIKQKSVRHIPEGYHSVTPYVICKDAGKAIDFYKKSLGARELSRFGDPSGKIAHAEILIGNSHLMLADEFPEMNFKSPKTLGGSPVSFMVYVEDVDFVAKQATKAGMKELKPVADQFYGDRSGTFEDPYGHTWTISTHIEDVTPAEMKKRAAALFGPK